MRLYLDSETCGLHGMPVLLQYAYADGPIHLWDVWDHPVGHTLGLLEDFCRHDVVGFNLAFDWFHVCKLSTIWGSLPRDWIPREHILSIAAREKDAQDGPCIKPAGACDLMLCARRGPLQAVMDRAPIRIRKVPASVADRLAAELEARIELDPILFARRAKPDAPRWKILPHTHQGRELADWRDVCLMWHPAGGLKDIAKHILGIQPPHAYRDVEPPAQWYPEERGYAPFGGWPAVIDKFIDHWRQHAQAREYARFDVELTRKLDAHFGHPPADDDDSALACMVAAVRWHGLAIDCDGIAALADQAQDVVEACPINTDRPAEVRDYIEAATVDDPLAAAVCHLEESTDKAHLAPIALLGDCLASRRAQEILAAKAAGKEVELYTKLLAAGKFHASFKVIGTLSNRMSGADGLNPLAIKKTKQVRRQFTLAPPGFVLCGGDFDAYEVTLADAVYNDPDLRHALESNKKIHGLFGEMLYPGMTYEEILATEGTADDRYTKAKSGVFAMIYGGDAGTLSRNLGIPLEVAEAAYKAWGERFPGIDRAQARIREAFCTLRQTGEIGSPITWHPPADYVESFLGFRRYFTLENKICQALVELAQNLPWDDPTDTASTWHNADGQSYQATHQTPVYVQRRERLQTVRGATCSALYGAAFAIQAAVSRAAANHEIQSPGGQILKSVQRAVWDLQPAGIHPFQVLPFNSHDELEVATRPERVKDVTAAVRRSVDHFRQRVPLIGMTWFESMENWAEKKSGTQGVKL